LDNNMSILNNTPFLLRVAKGDVDGHSIIQKIGANTGLTTSYTILALGTNYKMPQPAGAVTLRVKAGNANDTAAGSGAREITIEGLAADGTIQTESIATAGTSASANFAGTWIRLDKVIISASGTYPDQTNLGGAISHQSTIVIEDTGATQWAKISSTDLRWGASEIGWYTVPLGYTAYLLNYSLTCTTEVDFALFQRESILDAAAPYSPLSLVCKHDAVQNHLTRILAAPIKFDALTDFGFVAKGATTPDAACDFSILLIDDTVGS
jgi:hypothetical protein